MAIELEDRSSGGIETRRKKLKLFQVVLAGLMEANRSGGLYNDIPVNSLRGQIGENSDVELDDGNGGYLGLVIFGKKEGRKFVMRFSEANPGLEGIFNNGGTLGYKMRVSRVDYS
jgi:hypothetical protein